MGNYFFGNVGATERNNVVDLGTRAVNYNNNGFCANFARVPRRIPAFISLGRQCGRAPRVIVSFVRRVKMLGTRGGCLRFTHVSEVRDLGRIRNIMFVTGPSVLSKLAA